MKKTVTKKKKAESIIPTALAVPEEKVVTEDVYKAKVIIMGRFHEATGATAREAIAGLTPKNCKGRAILTIQKGEVKVDKILMPQIAFRLFNTFGLSREIALKNASLLFQGL